MVPRYGVIDSQVFAKDQSIEGGELGSVLRPVSTAQKGGILALVV